MAESLGVPIKIDEGCVNGWTKSIRVKVLIDLREPFTDEIIIKKGKDQRVTLPVKYERLPNICYFCGRVGHVERDCEAREEDGEGGHTYGFGEWMRASPWKSVKEGIHKTAANTEAGRRLIFKPQVTGEVSLTPSIDQMAETLLKVSFQRGEGNTTQGKEAPNTTGERREQATGQEMCNRKETKDTPPPTDQKKSTWQRFPRATDEEQKENNTRFSAMGKRDAGEAKLSEMDLRKKMKHADDTGSANILSQAEAAPQPRPAS